MTKTWDTKKKILKLLVKGQMTLSEISKALRLAPSTVSQHIEELERIGAIKLIENPYVKKWKYYRANPDFNLSTVTGDRAVSRMPMNRIPQVLAILVILGIVVFAFLSMRGLGVLQQQSVVTFQLTDPPQVPAGTSALLVTYSSVQAHLAGQSNSSGWISGSGGGDIDLMELVNASQVIGSADVPTNSTIDMVRFSITSAKIVINGTTYNVTVPNGESISAQLATPTRVNGTSSILVDLTPTVVTIYTQNSTVFVLVPYVRAIAIAGANVTAKIGFRKNLSTIERENLGRTASNITITGASLNVSQQNETDFSITVKNVGNESTVIRHVLVYGNDSVVLMPGFDVNVMANGTITPVAGRCTTCPSGFTASDNYCIPVCHSGQVCPQVVIACPTGMTTVHCEPFRTGMNKANNSSVYPSNCMVSTTDLRGLIGMDERGGMFMTVRDNNFAMINESGVANMPPPGMKQGMPGTGMGGAERDQENTQVSALLRVGLTVRHLKVLNFLVTQNATLVLPFMSPMPMMNSDLGELGYVLGPGASATFTFSGQVALGNGHINLLLLPRDVYRIVVGGERGAVAYTNVTAK